MASVLSQMCNEALKIALLVCHAILHSSQLLLHGTEPIGHVGLGLAYVLMQLMKLGSKQGCKMVVVVVNPIGSPVFEGKGC